MYKHISLSSSSSGNCHLISQDNGKTYVMLDGGITFKTLQSKLYALDIELQQIKGCVITHEHQDHIKIVKDILVYMPVFGTRGTFEGKPYIDDVNLKIIKQGKAFTVGETSVSFIAFDIKHDANEPVNYVFRNSINEYGVYITDTGEIKLKLMNIRPTIIIIETNFDRDVIEAQIKESMKRVVRDRGYESSYTKRQLEGKFGHLSVQDAIEVLKTMKLGMCKQILLCHISPSKKYDYFAEMVSKAFDYKYPVKQLSQFETEITVIDTKIDIGF